MTFPDTPNQKAAELVAGALLVMATTMGLNLARIAELHTWVLTEGSGVVARAEVGPAQVALELCAYTTGIRPAWMPTDVTP